MKKHKNIFVIIILINAIILGSMSGCKSETKDQKQTFDKEQYLNIAIKTDPKTLDSSKASDQYSEEILTEVMEGLSRIEQDQNGNDVIKPAGAEKWEVSEDGLIWNFHIRDYEWSDGVKVKAGDYVYGIERSLNSKINAENLSLLSCIKGAVLYSMGSISEKDLGVKAVDDKTLQITLNNICPYFLDITHYNIMYPQRKDIVESLGENYGSGSDGLVFCGPFVIKQWEHSQKIELEKNQKYWDSNSVKLNRVTMLIIKTEAERYQELLKGNIDSAIVNKSDVIKKYNSLNKFNITTTYDPYTEYEFFNQKNKILGNAKVRKAFSIAINREDLVKKIEDETLTPAYSFSPPNVQLNGESYRKKVNFEPVKKLSDENKDPKALLVEGLKEIGADEDTSKYTINYLKLGTDSTSKKYAETVKEMYEKILGVKINIDYAEWQDFYERIDNMKYDIADMTWSAQYNDPSAQFDLWVSGAGFIATGWSNNEYDDNIRKASISMDAVSRLNAYKEGENILLYDQAVIVPTTYKKRNIYTYKYVYGMMTPTFGSGVEFKYTQTSGRTSNKK